MSRFRYFLLPFTVVLAALVSYGLFTLPSSEPVDSEGFSSARVVEDIKVISKELHSVAHPVERAAVRDYLVERLDSLGAEITLFQYDSLESRGYRFDAVNVLAEFSPLKEISDTTYLMLVAHYDSRYAQPFLQDTVWSYGAADDGYGVGVVLETVHGLLKDRQEWNQGVKVLLTDAEEVGMIGMKSIWNQDNEVFSDVGLLINVEGRGPYGPALLFETGKGNSKVIDLYDDFAKYHYTYSLTNVVYQFMPNFTDFTIVKDSLPGLNFSTVADINHYHTHLDNIENINESSIQHYGEQILPIAKEYVTNPVYADKEYFHSDEDGVNFSIPLIGFLNFSKTQYLIFNIVIFVLFLLLFALESLRGRISFKVVVVRGLKIFLIALAVLLLGELIAWLSCVAAGAPFKLFGIVMGVTGDNAIMISSISVMAIIAVLSYCLKRRKIANRTSNSIRMTASSAAVGKNATESLFGASLLLFILSIVCLVAVGENLMFFVPLFAATVSMTLYRIKDFKLFILLAIVLICLHAFSFLYVLSMALTIGAFGLVMMLAFIDMMILIPMFDLYLTHKKTSRR